MKGSGERERFCPVPRRRSVDFGESRAALPGGAAHVQGAGTGRERHEEGGFVRVGEIEGPERAAAFCSSATVAGPSLRPLCWPRRACGRKKLRSPDRSGRPAR